MTTEVSSLLSTLLSAFIGHSQGLYAAGARRFLVANVPAVGCAPEARLVALNNSCLDPLNNLADDHNRLLNATLANLTSAWPDATILVGDTNGLLASSVAQPSAYSKPAERLCEVILSERGDGKWQKPRGAYATRLRAPDMGSVNESEV